VADVRVAVDLVTAVLEPRGVQTSSGDTRCKGFDTVLWYW